MFSNTTTLNSRREVFSSYGCGHYMGEYGCVAALVMIFIFVDSLMLLEVYIFHWRGGRAGPCRSYVKCYPYEVRELVDATRPVGNLYHGGHPVRQSGDRCRQNHSGRVQSHTRGPAELNSDEISTSIDKTLRGILLYLCYSGQAVSMVIDVHIFSSN